MFFFFLWLDVLNMKQGEDFWICSKWKRFLALYRTPLKVGLGLNHGETKSLYEHMGFGWVGLMSKQTTRLNRVTLKQTNTPMRVKRPHHSARFQSKTLTCCFSFWCGLFLLKWRVDTIPPSHHVFYKDPFGFGVSLQNPQISKGTPQTDGLQRMFHCILLACGVHQFGSLLI